MNTNEYYQIPSSFEKDFELLYNYVIYIIEGLGTWSRKLAVDEADTLLILTFSHSPVYLTF